MFRHHVDHAQRQDSRVDVEQPHPRQVRDLFGDRLQQNGQTVLDAEIGAVPDRVLRDEHDFLGPVRHEVDDLLQHMKGRLADLAALDGRDRAKRAVVVATVRHFDVRGGSGLMPVERGQHPLATGDFGRDRQIEERADDVADLEPLLCGEDVIDAGRDVVRVVAQRRHTAGRDHLLSLGPDRKHVRDHADRLIARRAEKSAGVDDDDVGAVERIGRSHATLLQKRVHAVRVDPVLGAAERDDVDSGRAMQSPWVRVILLLTDSSRTAGQRANPVP